MSYKVLFVLNALVLVLVGVALLFVPDKVLFFVGTIDRVESTKWAARFFGSALFALGAVLWFAKDVDGAAQSKVGWGMFISTLIGLVVTLMATFAGNAVIRGANSWVPSVAYAFFALFYAFMIFLKPRMKE
jgi:hypothetical protein